MKMEVLFEVHHQDSGDVRVGSDVTAATKQHGGEKRGVRSREKQRVMERVRVCGVRHSKQKKPHRAVRCV